MSRLKRPLLLVARILLGLLFAYSGFSKLVRPSEYFEFAISLYELFPAGLSWLASITLPWIEIVLGTFLVLGFESKRSSTVLASLMVAFQLILGQALVRGLRIDECGCFGGGLVHLTLYQSFALDTVMLLLLTQLAAGSADPISIDHLLLKGNQTT